MKGATMLATLQRLGVVPSFSRPRVSDDNPWPRSGQPRPRLTLGRRKVARPGLDVVVAIRSLLAGAAGGCGQ